MAEKKVMKQTVPKELSANVFKAFNRMTAENKRTLTLRFVESLSKSKKAFIDSQRNVVIIGTIGKRLMIMCIAYEFLKEHWKDLLIQYPKPQPLPIPPCGLITTKELNLVIRHSSVFLKEFNGELKLTTLSKEISYIPIVEGMMNIITMDM